MVAESNWPASHLRTDSGARGTHHDRCGPAFDRAQLVVLAEKPSIRAPSRRKGFTRTHDEEKVGSRGGAEARRGHAWESMSDYFREAAEYFLVLARAGSDEIKCSFFSASLRLRANQIFLADPGSSPG